MQETGTLKKLKVSVLDLFLNKHNLLKPRMKKNEKVLVINAWLSMQFLNATTNTSTEQTEEIDHNRLEDTDEYTDESDEDTNEYTDESDEERNDIVINEIGFSESSEDDTESNEENEIMDGNQDDMPAKITRSGRQVIQRKLFWQL